MMTFSYETKNKIVKSYANVCNQRKNLAKSLCYKAAMRFNYFIRTHQDGFNEMTYHYKELLCDRESFSKKKYFKSLSFEFLHNEQIFTCKKIYHKRTSYEIGYFITKNSLNPQEILQIIDILYCNKEYYLITESYLIETYDVHLRSYKVGQSDKKFHIVRAKEIISLPFNLQNISSGTYFRVKLI